MWYSLIRPLLFLLPPEQAHHLTFSLLKYFYGKPLRDYYLADFPTKPTEVCGLKFKNPIGVAAGLDKNGDDIIALQGLGFGFIELGTVTPKPQSGNPAPRLFRIPQAEALINRMGFNNKGVDYLVSRLQTRPHNIIIGANIGKQKETPLENALDDYTVCLRKVYFEADYIAINISSPNTPGLRQLQTTEYLHALLTGIMQVRNELEIHYHRRVPVWVKIAPDLEQADLTGLAEVLLQCQIDAVIATNTTLDHSAVQAYRYGNEAGGLSGLPLFTPSTRIIQQLNGLLQHKIPIIAVGGILTPEQALAKFSAGASLIQLYTGLIYRGPKLVKEILKKILE